MPDEDKNKGGLKSVLSELPLDRLKDELQQGFSAFSGKAVESAGERITGLTDKLSGVADGGGVVGKAAKGGAKEAAKGGSPVKGAVKGGLSGAKDKVKEKLGGGKGGGGSKATKSTNIIEEIDIGVPVHVAYNQWTQFQDFSNFMKKVDSAESIGDVEQGDEVKVDFKAQVFWSHREWEATILEQVADEKIVWRSKGAKGHVDGTVTFHELAPRLTRILVVLEYYPQGLFERTGNLWRAQGRRARLELKHFRRHVMTQVILEPDEVEGWRGEVRDSQVERTHDEVVEEEEQQEQEQEDQYDEEPEGDEEAADEYEEEEPEGDEEAADEYEDEEPEEGEEAADEYEDEEPEEGEEGEEAADEYEDEEPEGDEEDQEGEEAADEYEEEEPEEGEEGEEPEEDEEVAEDYEEEEPEEGEEAADEDEEEPAPRRRRRTSQR